MASAAGPSASSSSDERQEKAEPDSVDLELGNGEFSEATLDRVRDFPRPSWYKDPPPESPMDDDDAVEALPGMLATGAPLPPPAYAAAQEQAKKLQEAAVEIKSVQVDPDTNAEIEYRRRLMEGTSVEDRKWLKLKAYHRAQDLRRAEEAKLKAAEQQLQIAEQQLLQQQQQQQLEQLQQQQRAAVAAKKGGVAAGSPSLSTAATVAAAAPAVSPGATSISAHPFTVRQLQPLEYSEESEWAPDWKSSSYLRHNPAAAALLEQHQMLAAQAAAVAGGNGSSSIWHSHWLDLQPVSSSSAPVQIARVAEATGQQPHQHGSYPADAGIGNSSMPEAYANGIVRGYMPAYLHEKQLEAQLRRQKMERKLSFWLAFGAVTSIALLKALRHRMRKQRKAKAAEGAKSGEAALANVGSGLVSAASGVGVGGTQGQLPARAPHSSGRQGSLTGSGRRTAA